MAQGKPNAAYNDSAFLYLLFTAQFFILLFGSIFYLRALFGKNSKASKKSLIVKGILLLLILFWFYNVFQLVMDDANITKDFDPYTILGVPQGSSDTKAIKKAYRNLAVKYHPDKVDTGPSVEDAKLKFQELVMAYEILTDPQKYDNWQKYGNPDGSKAYKAIEIALPSFLLKSENQGTVLIVFFLGFICVPIVYVFQHMKKRERIFKNGLLNGNRSILIKKIVDTAKLNKLSFKFNQEQVIEIYEEAIELTQINEELAKKTTVRDLLMQKLSNKPVQSEFKDAQDKIITLIPKINELMFDDQTCIMMIKGKIQSGNRMLSLNIPDIYQSLTQVSQKLFQKNETQGSQSVFKAELKSYIDGQEPDQPILQNYVMTFELKISKSQGHQNSSQANDVQNLYYYGLLIEDQANSVEQIFRIKLVSKPEDTVPLQFPLTQKFTTLLQKEGFRKYSILILSNYGDLIRSNQTSFNVLQMDQIEEEDKEDEEEEYNEDEAQIKNLDGSDEDADDEEDEDEDDQFEKED